jgi:TPR repeat protein
MRELLTRYFVVLGLALLALGSTVFEVRADEEKAKLYGDGLAAFEAGDLDRAYVIWKPLAENGYAVAQYSLGKLFDLGGGSIQRNPFVAALWYSQAAAQGVAAAQNNLAIMYARGNGVPPNPERAVELWREAAGQGHPMAQFNLGLSYFNGDGVDADPEEAIAWFRRAADGGITDAQFALGQIYRRGAGVPSDPRAALAWYEQAALQGHEAAGKEAEKLRIDLGLPDTASSSEGVAETSPRADQGAPPSDTQVAERSASEPPPPIPGKSVGEGSSAVDGSGSAGAPTEREPADSATDAVSEDSQASQGEPAESADTDGDAAAEDTSALAQVEEPAVTEEEAPSELPGTEDGATGESGQPSEAASATAETIDTETNDSRDSVQDDALDTEATSDDTPQEPDIADTSPDTVAAQQAATRPLTVEDVLGKKNDFRPVDPEVKKEGEVEWESVPRASEGPEEAVVPLSIDSMEDESLATTETETQNVETESDSATMTQAAAEDLPGGVETPILSTGAAQVALLAVKPPLVVPEPSLPRRKPDLEAVIGMTEEIADEARPEKDPTTIGAPEAVQREAAARVEPDPAAPNSTPDSGESISSASAEKAALTLHETETRMPPGTFGVWLASTADEAAARSFWALVTESYPTLFSRVSGSVQKIDLGDLGIYYRVVAGTWRNEDDAREVCLRIRLRQPDAFCKIQTN